MMDGELQDRVPPYNLEAEQATLGALLLDSEALSSVQGFIGAEDFYKRSHQIIFTAIVSLEKKNEVPDLITLIDYLTAEKKLKECGDIDYVSMLTEKVPTSANVEYYARIVQDCSIRRTLLRTAREIAQETHDRSKDSRTIVDFAEKKIYEVTDRQQSHAYHVVSEIIPKTIEVIEKLYHTKANYTGVPSGFADLDNMTSGFQNSEFVVIGARPSVGKTAFALSVAANIAIEQHIPVGFFTLEMSAMALMQRLVSSEARIASEKLRTGMLRPSDFHSLMEAAGRIYEAPLYISDEPNMRLLDLRAQARRMKKKEGIKVFFVDYIGLIEAENKANVPRHEQVAEISRSLKALARELNSPIVCLSQVGRQSEGKEPTLADLRESGSIEQDADVVMFLHRDRGTSGDGKEVNNVETELIVAKQRNGPVGKVRIAFLPQYTKFESFTKMNE